VAERLQELADALAIPGLPSWVGFVLLLAIAISVLSLLAMPYSVFGVKSRLEAIEAEIADLRVEIRAILSQAPAAAPPARASEEIWVPPPSRAAAPTEEPRLTAPVPPPAARADRPGRGRAEPRLDWPRSDAAGD
jgi:hypothetical protein